MEDLLQFSGSCTKSRAELEKAALFESNEHGRGTNTRGSSRCFWHLAPSWNGQQLSASLDQAYVTPREKCLQVRDNKGEMATEADCNFACSSLSYAWSWMGPVLLPVQDKVEALQCTGKLYTEDRLHAVRNLRMHNSGSPTLFPSTGLGWPSGNSSRTLAGHRTHCSRMLFSWLPALARATCVQTSYLWVASVSGVWHGKKRFRRWGCSQSRFNMLSFRLQVPGAYHYAANSAGLLASPVTSFADGIKAGQLQELPDGRVVSVLGDSFCHVPSCILQKL